ncbi:MAG: S9 family peptidase, partial [Pyrinomonadaceae bacterium]
MSERRVAPHGAWKSPITSDLIVSGTVGLGQIVIDGENIYWTEMRPSEAGRNCVVRHRPDGWMRDETLPRFNARTRVHEYGGGAYAVVDGTVYFSNFADQRVYCESPEKPPRPLTPAVDLRYADFAFDRGRSRLIAVREDHTAEGREAVNSVVSLAVDDDGAEGADAGTDRVPNPDGGRVLVLGHDFYSSPRLSPDGSRLAWLAWNHPNMPWDGCELWVAALENPEDMRRVAGGPGESIWQPDWSPAGELHFV